MIDEKTIDDILAGEFSGDFATQEQKDIRYRHIVRRVGTTRSVANAQRMMQDCENAPGLWHWSDGSYTVVDIRPKVSR